MYKKYNAGKLFYTLMSISVFSLFLHPLLIPIAGNILTIYIGEVFLLLCMVLWLFTVGKKRYFALNYMGKFSLLLIFVGLLSLINTTNIGRYMIGLSAYLETTFIILMFSDIVFNEKSTIKLMKYYTCLGCILAIFIIYQMLTVYKGNFILGVGKIILSIGASNYLASMLLITFFISLTAILRNRISLFNIINFSLVITAIIFTASRAAMFILMAFFPIYVLKDLIISKQMNTIKKIVSSVLILTGIGLSYIVGKNFITQMIQIGKFNNLFAQSNLLTRFDIFHYYLHEFYNHPFIGHGYLNVKLIGGENIYAHNTFLQILGDTGVFSLVIFICLIISIFRFLTKSYKTALNNEIRTFILGYKRGFLAVFIHGMIEPNFGTKLFMIYIFIGLGIIISSKTINKENTLKPNPVISKA